jgi:hypothetical protein
LCDSKSGKPYVEEGDDNFCTFVLADYEEELAKIGTCP